MTADDRSSCKLMWEKLRTILRHVWILSHAIRLFGAFGRLPVVSGLLLGVQGLLPLATVCLSKTLVDSLVVMRGGVRWESASPVILTAFAIAAVMVVGEVLRAVSGWVRTNLSERVQDHIMDLVHRKSVELDLSFYDSADFFDRMHRARMEASYRPVAMIESLGSVFQNSITLLAMFGVLLSFGWWLPVALLVSTVPAFWVVLRYAVRQHEFRVRTTRVPGADD